MISELVFGNNFVAQPAGDALSISECTDIQCLCLKLDRRSLLDHINDSCYHYIPLSVPDEYEPYFVEIPSKRVYREYPKKPTARNVPLIS